MRFNLFILISLSFLAEFAFTEHLYASSTIVLALSFAAIFIKENINVYEVRKLVEKIF